MTSDAEKLIMDLCFRIERMCRYAPLDEQEVQEGAVDDRSIVAGLYRFYRLQGDDKEQSAKKARANAIRLVLSEVFS
jgi:hypothetical protein